MNWVGGRRIGTSGSLRDESHEVVEEDDDETTSVGLLPFCATSLVTPSMFKEQRMSTGLVPSSSGVVAPRDDGDARENGDDDAVGDGVEQWRCSVKLAGNSRRCCCCCCWVGATAFDWSPTAGGRRASDDGRCSTLDRNVVHERQVFLSELVVVGCSFSK